MAVSTYGPPGSEEDDEPDSGWDFSGLGNPSAMRDFMTACDYCLSDCSDDGHSLDDEGCGPSRECFHVDVGGLDEGNHLGMLEDDDPPRPAPRVDILWELAVVPALRGVRTHSSSKSARYRPGSTYPGRTTPSDAGAIHHRGRRIQGELKNLLEDASVRRAESSASRRQGYPPEHRAATSRFMREASVHTGRTRDATPVAPGRLGNEHHRRDCRAHLDEKVCRGYHPRRGGRYDSGEDRSPSPEPPGPQAFSRAIRRAPFPTRFRTPTTITKYSGETRLELWLADYRLACQLGGTDNDNLIIRNLPLFLSDAARAWLEHLPPA
jgi:hypothetical protein